MIEAPIANWLDVLWEAVCTRAGRPIPGILLDQDAIVSVAREVFEKFLADGDEPAPTLQAMMNLLTRPVIEVALTHVAQARVDKNDPDYFRDLAKARWENNPPFPELIARRADGCLHSEYWTQAEPILWQRASPIYKRMHISETDAQDVYAETIAHFLKARPVEECPMRKARVFEELPRLFGVVAERRAISWIRKQSALKMQPNRSGVSLDDPDNLLSNRLPEKRSLETEDPLTFATFDQIRRSCAEVLDDFAWHLLEVIFVEGTHTRDELILDDEIIAQLDVDPSASRSTKLRRLNSVLSTSLSRLGRSLQDADL